ncbi:MAG: hypothetical protein INR71_10890, partial [Terriglobus roseus]|nr:hypothetical protein [Terriglobus roseus]
NTTSDPMAQLATLHSAEEIAFVKRVIDAMFDDRNRGGREIFAVLATEAVRLAKAPPAASAGSLHASNVGMGDGETQGQTQGGAAASITMARSEEVLQLMCEGAWFEKSRAGFYSLGPRGLMELKGWLQSNYNEPPQEGDTPEEVEAGKRIRFCEACKDIVTVVRVSPVTRADEH